MLKGKLVGRGAQDAKSRARGNVTCAPPIHKRYRCLISFLINPFACNMKVWALSCQETPSAFVSNPCLAVKQARPLTNLVCLFMFIESQQLNIDMSLCIINILSHSKLLCPDCGMWLAPCLSPGLLLPSPLLYSPKPSCTHRIQGTCGGPTIQLRNTNSSTAS
jgi:hypothetical protein